MKTHRMFANLTAILTMLSPMAASASVVDPVACWKHTDTRGVGTIPNVAPPNTYVSGLLAYPDCAPGYYGVGPVCWQSCPSGYTDTGAFCTYSAGPLTKPLECQSWWYDLCTSYGCPSNYTNAGLFCAANTFAKGSYGNGVGVGLSCASDQEYDAGLCYTPCSSGDGIGPVCWAECPANFPVSCGAMCAVSDADCATETTNIVLASAAVAVNIASAGSAGPATDAALAAADAEEAATMTSKVIDVMDKVVTVSSFANDQAAYATSGNTIVGNAPPGDADAELASLMLTTADPTGVAALALSLTKPICGQSWGAVWAVTGKFYPYGGTLNNGNTLVSDTMSVSWRPAAINGVTQPETLLWQEAYPAQPGTPPSYTDPGQPLPYMKLMPALLDIGGKIHLKHTAVRSDGSKHTGDWLCQVPYPAPATGTVTQCANSNGKDKASFTWDRAQGTIAFTINGPGQAKR